MKEKIYEIPIWDAFNAENCQCPLCFIEKKSDDNYIEALFTEMVMDVRLNPQLVKDYDFCHNHFEKLYRYPDKFGLAVLTNRILYSKRENIKSAQPRGELSKKPYFKSLFSKEKTSEGKSNVKSCLLCERLNKDMESYIETLINLWLKEEKFREAYSKSQGFCINHFDALTELSGKMIKNEAKHKEFSEITLKVQEESMSLLQEDLEWFISKFDYRFKDEPWKNSKDALIRTIQKLIGNYNEKI